MVDDPTSLILTLLRKIDSRTDRLAEDMQDVKRRLTSLEAAVVGVHGDFAGQSIRIDRLEQRLDRIERRLEIGDA
jgi:tetrahydromethanopterin S-methyltransferase subunit G